MPGSNDGLNRAEGTAGAILKQRLDATLAGFGLTYVPEDVILPLVARGRLKRVLEDWCLPFPGYHLYYSGRRQLSPAFTLLIEALRYRE